MRHVYIRSILALIWLAAAVIGGVSGRIEMAVLYVMIGAAFLYHAYFAWKKEKNGRGGE